LPPNQYKQYLAIVRVTSGKVKDTCYERRRVAAELTVASGVTLAGLERAETEHMQGRKAVPETFVV
jgi:hypothetical protein